MAMGVFMPLVAGGKGKVSELTLITFEELSLFYESPSWYVMPPAGQEGDIIIIMHTAAGSPPYNSTGPIEHPDGYVAGFSGDNHFSKSFIYYRIQPTSAPLPKARVTASGTIGRCYGLLFRPNAPIENITNTGFNTATSGNVISVGAAKTPVIVLAQAGASNTVPNLSSTPAMEDTKGANYGRSSYKLYNTNPVNHTVSVTSGSNRSCVTTALIVS